MTEPERDLVEQLRAMRAGMSAVMQAIKARKKHGQSTALRAQAYWEGYEAGMTATLNASIGIIEDRAGARGEAAQGEPRSASVLDVQL